MTLKRTYNAIITIDDSPSPIMEEILDTLAEYETQAIFFCRGDLIDQALLSEDTTQRDALIRAIQDGHILGNHLYDHIRSSKRALSDVIKSIERTELLLNELYTLAGHARKERYLRFPYMDAGLGAWPIPYHDQISETTYSMLQNMIDAGLGNDPKTLPTDTQCEAHSILQKHLSTIGISQPDWHLWSFEGRHSALPAWFTDYAPLTHVKDTQFTCSSSDWMLTQRHLERDWPYKNSADCTGAMMQIIHQEPDALHILLFHDQEELLPHFKEALQSLVQSGVVFGKRKNADP